MSNSNDMMQMEARRRFMNQQMAAGRPPIPDSQHMEAQRFHQERPPAQQWQNNPPSDSTTMLPPMCFLRKEIMYKLINYRIDEEEGNKIMNKYKEMIQSLKARLEKERLSLIKLDGMMNGDSQNSNQIPFALDSKPIDPMKNQPRRDSIATSQRNDVDMMRNKNERPKMNPFESEIPQDKSSNLNLSMTNDPNFKRNQINTMRQIGNAVPNKDQSGKIPKGGKGKGGEFTNELEENKGYQRNFPTPSGSLIQEDNQIRQTPTDSQRELKSLPFVMNTHPRVLEIQKKEAGRNTPIANQRFNDISIKLSKDKEGDIDGKKYNLRHKIEEGGNSEIKLK